MYDSNKENGFSLISVVVASSIMTVVTLAISHLIQNQSESVNYLEDKLTKVDLKGNILGNMSDKDACKNTLQGLAVKDSQKILSLKNKDDNVVYDLQNKDEINHIKITDIQLLNETLPNSPNQTGNMRLQFNTKRTRGNTINFAPFDIWIKAFTDASGQISECYAFGGGSSINTYDEARKCENNPPILAPNQRYMNTNKSGPYDEGTAQKGPCQNGGNYLVVCINGKWRNLTHYCNNGK